MVSVILDNLVEGISEAEILKSYLLLSPEDTKAFTTMLLNFLVKNWCLYQHKETCSLR